MFRQPLRGCDNNLKIPRDNPMVSSILQYYHYQSSKRYMILLFQYVPDILGIYGITYIHGEDALISYFSNYPDSNMWLIILIVTDHTSLERYLALTYLDMI
jgi:hypothetical protein